MYEDRILAFIDVLGFKSHIDNTIKMDLKIKVKQKELTIY